MKLTIIGTGYVGLVTGVCFSDLGFDVTCVDKDEHKIESLKNREVPFYEPELSDYLERNIDQGRLNFTTDLDNAIRWADLIFIAVGTPCDEKTGRANLSDVHFLLKTMAPLLNDSQTVVIKSTVPLGTAKKAKEIIKSCNPNIDVNMAVNPEFLREGSAIQDFREPDRIVVGSDNPTSKGALQELYSSFAAKGVPLIETTLESAEFIKHTANAFLATKISFINQISDLCEKANGDIRQVARAIGLDHRIGKEFLNAGPGFGGSCFPKDMQELIHSSHEIQLPLTIVEAAFQSNKKRQEKMSERIISFMGGSVSGKTLAILGLTFKANTDDLRDSPSLTILPRLIQAGANLKVYDPKGMKNAVNHLTDVHFAESVDEAIDGAEALVILTEWKEFANLDLEKVRRLLKSPVIIDFRNLFSFDDMKNHQFTYHSLGHASIIPNS